MKAYKSLLKYALAQGLAIHVDNGGDENIKCSGYAEAVEEIEATGEASVTLASIARNANGKYVRYGWAFVITGLDDEETVADYSDNKLLNTWFDAYYQDHTFTGIAN